MDKEKPRGEFDSILEMLSEQIQVLEGEHGKSCEPYWLREVLLALLYAAHGQAVTANRQSKC